MAHSDIDVEMPESPKARLTRPSAEKTNNWFKASSTDNSLKKYLNIGNLA